MNLKFELKCAFGLPGYFAGTVSGYYICLDPPFVVDSSFVPYPCDFFMFTPTTASAERHDSIFECAICSLDSG